MSPSRTAKQALADLESRLRLVKAPILAGLRPGLTESHALRLFSSAGVRPDSGLVALYTWHNGAVGGGSQGELMDTARFLSLEEALESREFALRVVADSVLGTGTAAEEVFDPTWFPILSPAHAGLYVVEKLGAGRVVTYEFEQGGISEVLSASLIEFIDSLSRDGLDFKPPAPSADAAVLVARLASEDENERVNATRELTRKRPPAAFEPLVAMLESPNSQARRTAALILGLLHDRLAIPILIRCVATWSAEQGDSARDAASALAGLRDVTDEGWLVHVERAIAEGDTQLRLDAITSLAFSRDARSVPSLQAAASHDPNPIVRAAAERALTALSEDTRM